MIRRQGISPCEQTVQIALGTEMSDLATAFQSHPPRILQAASATAAAAVMPRILQIPEAYAQAGSTW